MACFLVPMGEAIGTSIVQKAVGKEKAERWRLGQLNTLLWGGVAALAAEHALHGEIVPWPPFLTAMQSPQDTAAMLHEMGMVGVPMAIAVTVVWAVMVALTRKVAKPLPTKTQAESTI